MLRFKKFHNTLNELYKKQSKLSERYTLLTDEAGCIYCKYYNSKAVDTFENKFSNCNNCPKVEEIKNVSRELDDIENAIDSFIESEYAISVFEYFKSKKPRLVEKSTGKQLEWDEAFGTDFSKISKILKHSIVGLNEGTGRYIIK